MSHSRRGFFGRLFGALAAAAAAVPAMELDGSPCADQADKPGRRKVPEPKHEDTKLFHVVATGNADALRVDDSDGSIGLFCWDPTVGSYMVHNGQKWVKVKF